MITYCVSRILLWSGGTTSVSAGWLKRRSDGEGKAQERRGEGVRATCKTLRARPATPRSAIRRPRRPKTRDNDNEYDHCWNFEEARRGWKEGSVRQAMSEYTSSHTDAERTRTNRRTDENEPTNRRARSSNPPIPLMRSPTAPSCPRLAPLWSTSCKSLLRWRWQVQQVQQVHQDQLMNRNTARARARSRAP